MLPIQKRTKRFFLGVLAAFFFAGCGALSGLVDSLTSADCDDFVASELTSSLADNCRDLSNYLDQESDSLGSVSQLMPIAPGSLATTGATFIQLTDASGDPLTGIDASDVTVEVSEDGNTFTEVEGATLTPLSEVQTTQTALLFNIDHSASILDDDLDDVVSGLNTFLEVLSVGYAGAVIKFSTDVDLVEDFTETESLIMASLNDTSYDRASTSLYDAIYDGVTHLSDQTTPLKLMVLFTDGIDNDSSHTRTEAIAHAQTNGIPVCIVGVTFADTATLQEIASQTGCFYVYKQLFTSLNDSFEAFAGQINGFQMIDLPDDFNVDSGTLRVSVDAGEGALRQFTQAF